MLVDGQSVLVKPDATLAQMQADAQQQTAAGGDGNGIGSTTEGTTTGFSALSAGTGRGVVSKHLIRIVGAQVEITLEIQANLPEGATEKLVRDVTENCRTLHFNNYGFEEA